MLIKELNIKELNINESMSNVNSYDEVRDLIDEGDFEWEEIAHCIWYTPHEIVNFIEAFDQPVTATVKAACDQALKNPDDYALVYAYDGNGHTDRVLVKRQGLITLMTDVSFHTWEDEDPEEINNEIIETLKSRGLFNSGDTGKWPGVQGVEGGGTDWFKWKGGYIITSTEND